MSSKFKNKITVALAAGGVTVNAFCIILFYVVLLIILLWYGNYPAFEKVHTFFVILMGLSFIVCFFMMKPDLSAIAKGLIPGIPDIPGAYELVAAIAGTTCSAAVFIMRSTVVAEKGWVFFRKHSRLVFSRQWQFLFIS